VGPAGAHRDGDLGAIVDHEQDVGIGRGASERGADRDQLVIGQVGRAELDRAGPAFEGGHRNIAVRPPGEPRRGDHVDAERSGIDSRHRPPSAGMIRVRFCGS
jgi:hypothetical protein